MHRELNPIYQALGDVKVEHLGTLKNAFQQLEADWCKQLAAGGKRHGGPRGRRQRAVRSAAHRGRENRSSRAGRRPSPALNGAENGEAQRPHSPNSTSLRACSNGDQQHGQEGEQQQQQQGQQGQQQQQQARQRGRSVGSARQATHGQSPSGAPHADMKRKAPGDGAGAGSRPGPKSQGGVVTMGDALRHASPKPKKKKQRPPWVDNSIPCLPQPFTSDPGPSGSDAQDVSNTPADKPAQGDAHAAAPATPLPAPHPSSSPASSSQKQPPSPSRIPKHPDKDEAPPSATSVDHSMSRIPHFNPSDPVPANSSPPRQRKHWGVPVAAQEVAPLAAAGVPVQPPQLRRGSPIRPASDAPPAETPPSSSAPTSTPQQHQQPGGSPAHHFPSPISALRASAMENLKEGRHRSIQSRSPLHAHASPAAAPVRCSLSVEELPRPRSWDESDPGPALKRSSYTQLPPLPNPAPLEAIPGSPAHTSPHPAAHPHSTSQPITEAEGGDNTKASSALGSVAASVDGSAASMAGHSADEAGGQQPGGPRKEGYLRKLSALKRTVGPPSGSSPPHPSQGGGSSQAAKQARPSVLPPVLEPATNGQHDSSAQDQQQQQQLSSPSGRLLVDVPRPVSEPAPAGMEGRQGVHHPEGRPRRVSDLGSPAKSPHKIEGGPFGWHGHDSAGPGLAGGGGLGSDGAVPPAAPPSLAAAGDAAGAAAAAGGGAGKPGRARWQVAPETRQAAWRWEGDAASSLARSSSSPFPDAYKPNPGASTPPPHKASISSSAQPVPVPSNGKSSLQQGNCLLPPASPLLANSPSRPAVRPASPSPHSSLQRPPTTHQEISAAAASAAAHGYAPAPLTGSAASAPNTRRISAPGAGGPPSNAPRKPPPHSAYPHNPLPPAANAWLPPSAFTDHGRPPTHPQVPWSLPPYPSGPSAPSPFPHSNTAHDHFSLPPRAYHHQPNATVPRAMVGGHHHHHHHQPLHNAAPNYSGYPTGYLTTQPSIPLSTISSPAATPPWMTLRDPSAYANGNYNHKHGGLDAALNALQQQQQQQQYAQYGARRTTVNGHAQEPSRIMDIMRMSSSKFITGWETAAPHEAATGPLSRFADVWRQRNSSSQLSEHNQEQHRHQEQQLQAPASQPPAHSQTPQQEQQHQPHQQGESTPPPAMDRRQLKLQSAFNGLSLGEVLANSAKKEPPFPKKQPNNNAQAAGGVAAARDK